MASYLAKMVENKSDKKAFQLFASAYVQMNVIAYGRHLRVSLFVPKSCGCHLEGAAYHPDISYQVLVIIKLSSKRNCTHTFCVF